MEKQTSDKLMLSALGLFAFSVIFSVTVVQGALLIALALLLVKNYQEHSLPFLKTALTGHPLFIPWLVTLGVCLLTALTEYYPLKGLSQLNSDFFKFVCLFTLLFTVKKEHLPKLSFLYTIGAVTAALIGLGEVTSLLPSDNPDKTRADAFMNAVRYGEVMGIAALFALSRTMLPFKASTRREQSFYYISTAIIFTALLASKTRGAYLGTFTGTLIMFFLIRASWKRLLAAFITLLIAAAFTAYVTPDFYGRLPGMVKTTGEILSSAPSSNVRPRMWRVGLKMLADHPLLGVGPDNTRAVFAQYCPELIMGKTWGALHNLYIHQAAGRGLLGLGALLFLFGAMFNFARKNFKTVRSPYTLWALCVLPAFYVMNITEISFQHVHTSFAIFLALAFSAAGRAE